eukprot:1859047-Amphidinium_carterae.1
MSSTACCEVVHVAGSRLACVSLPQFSRGARARACPCAAGGELFRVNYPHWSALACFTASTRIVSHVTFEGVQTGAQKNVETIGHMLA